MFVAKKVSISLLLTACFLGGCTPISQAPTRSTSVTQSGAVQSLYLQAQEARAAGQTDKAEAALERAVRIEPANPHLWLELAQLSKDKGDDAKARSLAQRARSLAGTDAVLNRQINRLLSSLD